MSQDIRTAKLDSPITSMPPAAPLPLAWLTPGRAALITTLLSFILYLVTMNRTFGFVDKGELVAVAGTAGIAHPTGYPTTMILGYLFTLIMPMREVLALNVMSALLTAAGAGALVLLLDDLIGRTIKKVRSTKDKGPKTKGRKGKREERVAVEDQIGIAPGARAAIAGLTGLFVACSATWWNQGNGFEVYSLHALLMSLITLFFLRYVDEERLREDALDESGRSAGESRIGFTKRGFWFAFLLGLSFTNHMTTILLAPAFLVYYFWTLRFNTRSLTRLLYLAPPFILGLLPYAWLPIRASMNPRFNWGDPRTLENFIDHVSGKIYQVYMFENTTVFEQQTAFFFSHLPAEAAYAGLLLALLGIVLLAMRSARLSVFVALLFIACILYSGNYDIMEIGPYYMTAIFAIGIWCAFGLIWLNEKIGATAMLGIAALLVAGNCALNYEASDESGNTLVEDMTVNVLGSLPKNSVIFSAQWDFWVAGSFYMQAVENLRPDVIVVDPELVRRRWYVDQLTYTYPEFMGRVKEEADLFKREVLKFDRGEPYDANILQGAYIGLMNAMIDKHINERPMFVTGEVDPMVGNRYTRTPNYLTLRLVPGGAYLPETFPSYRFKIWDRVDGYTSKTYELYARSALARALYESQYGNDSLALRYYNLALSFDPGFTYDKIPDLPLNSEEQVSGMIRVFEDIRKMRKQ